MIEALDVVIFVVLIVAAVLALVAKDLLTAVAMLTAYSLFVSLLFAGVSAVDVSLVEAALGAGVTGLLLIAAILATTRRSEPRPDPRRRYVVLPLVGLFLAMMLYAATGLPDRGDPEAPAQLGVSQVYLSQSLADTETPNVVTSLLADYRSQDTLGETLVILTAALSAAMVLVRRRDEDDHVEDSAEGSAEDSSDTDGGDVATTEIEGGSGPTTEIEGGSGPTMLGAYPSVVVRVVSAVLVPFLLLFGVYIIAHGHYGPGGGFAGGVFLAVGAILPRLTLPSELAYRLFPTRLGPLVGGLGMLLFLLVAVAPLVAGGVLLDYGAIEVPGLEASRVRYLGILIVEVAVGFAVFGAIVLIFDVITGADDVLRRLVPTDDAPETGGSPVAGSPPVHGDGPTTSATTTPEDRR